MLFCVSFESQVKIGGRGSVWFRSFANRFVQRDTFWGKSWDDFMEKVFGVAFGDTRHPLQNVQMAKT